MRRTHNKSSKTVLSLLAVRRRQHEMLIADEELLAAPRASRSMMPWTTFLYISKRLRSDPQFS
ncbi:MAG TPA: hypothetical protein VMG82_25660 [Candidatus Sulfotelmatobacter sp.]|nr:hypothetical protein [Candidatus Sulfotelmatobacter sp.]